MIRRWAIEDFNRFNGAAFKLCFRMGRRCDPTVKRLMIKLPQDPLWARLCKAKSAEEVRT